MKEKMNKHLPTNQIFILSYSIIPIHWDMQHTMWVRATVDTTIIGHGKTSAFSLFRIKTPTWQHLLTAGVTKYSSLRRRCIRVKDQAHYPTDGTYKPKTYKLYIRQENHGFHQRPRAGYTLALCRREAQLSECPSLT